MESAPLPIDNLEQVRTRIRDAAERCGRNPTEIALLAVSKAQPTESIQALLAQGQREFGENYLQEALDKIDKLGPQPVWHYIGQLQSNKTRAVAENFAWVHTVDRLKIAQRLHEQRPDDFLPLNVCIQVKLAEEAGKGGVAPAEALALASAIARLPRLRLRGLMCIPPPADEHAEQFAYFKTCADLLRTLNHSDPGLSLDTLSMGMSADLDAAIEAGATIVRIGTALFGPRTKMR